MNLQIGNANTILFNGNDVQRVVFNGVEVWSKTQPTHDYSKDYFTVEAITSGTFIIKASTNDNCKKGTIYYSINDGNWTSKYLTTSSNLSINMSVGDKIRFCCELQNGIFGGSSNQHQITGGTAQIKVYGNVRSLESGTRTDPVPSTGNRNGVASGCRSMFYGNTTIVDAENLVLYDYYSWGTYMFYRMFYQCTALEKAPKYLYNDRLVASDYCCNGMFYQCGSIESIDNNMLPCKQLGNSSYTDMFKSCTSLTNACEVPATSMTANSCKSMFDSCSNLSSAPSILPCTTLGNTCYRNMFYGCTHLLNAPELPNPSNITSSSTFYQQMFYGCNSLGYIKCLASTIGSNLTTNWVYGVRPRGTFIKKSGVTWPSGTSGIPNDWTVSEE